MQRYLNPYRLASYVLLFYVLGHTFGALLVEPDFGSAGHEVAVAMQRVHFSAQGFDMTWYGFYLGFGWLISLFVAYSGWILWKLGGWSAQVRRGLSAITVPLLFIYIANLALAFKWFFWAPIICSTLVVLLLGIGLLQDRRSVQAG
jgi:hypothetical protein